MTEWNFNIAEAPRGHTETRIAKGKPYEVFVGDRIIAAGTGDTVTVSQWLPKFNRWEMFTVDVPPIAWMPWPEHPTPPSNANAQTGEK